MTSGPRPVPGHSRNLTATLRTTFHALMEGINTSMPGIVETFDALTRRARVRPALQVEVGGGHRDHVYLLDVPVITPFGTEYGLTVDVQAGSVVQLVFSQRGIGLFKEAFENSPPDELGFFGLQDAVAVAGLGPLDLTPALPLGVAMQHVDGERYVGIDENGIYVISGGKLITIDAGNPGPPGDVTIDGMNVTVTGVTTVHIDAGTGDVTIEGANVTLTGLTTVNGVRIADAGAGTQAASGPGSHVHGLTAA